MKTQYISFLVIFLFSTTLFSQTDLFIDGKKIPTTLNEILKDSRSLNINDFSDEDYFEFNNSNMINDVIWVNDSFYQYRGNKQSWDDYYRYFVLNRNENGLLTEGVGQLYFNNKWVNYKKYNAYYNSDFDENDYLIYIWNWKDEKWGDTLSYRKYLGDKILINMSRRYSYSENTFITGGKTIVEYNNDGNKVMSLDQIWSNADQKWVNKRLDSVKYINNEKIISSRFDWNAEDKNWNKKSITISEKDDDGNEIYLLVKDRIDSLNEIVNSYQVFSTFNDNHKSTSFLLQYWNNETNDWVNNKKVTNSYQFGNLVTENSNLKWDTKNLYWKKEKRFINTFNSDSTRNTELSQFGSLSDTLWHNSTLNTYEYFDDSLVINRKLWDIKTDSWRNNSKSLYLYDDNRMIVAIIKYRWDKIKKVWKNISAVRYE